MKYKIGDIVRLVKPHTEGDTVVIQEITKYPGWLGKLGKKCYKIYIPYWDYFYISNEDIIEKVGEVSELQR